MSMHNVLTQTCTWHDFSGLPMRRKMHFIFVTLLAVASSVFQAFGALLYVLSKLPCFLWATIKWYFLLVFVGSIVYTFLA